MRLISSVNAVKRVQVRFPHSKKKRIRQKWAARDSNCRWVPIIIQLDPHTLVAPPEFLELLRRELPVASSFSPWACPNFHDQIHCH